MGDKTIPDSAEPRLESFYPPFVAGIDLPHQGVVDSYNLYNGNSYTGKMASSYSEMSLQVILYLAITLKYGKKIEWRKLISYFYRQPLP